ncbi:MAG: hypothetical protein ACI856_002911, partial [Kiritimatiellia bacterium]
MLPHLIEKGFGSKAKNALKMEGKSNTPIGHSDNVNAFPGV